MDTEDIEIGMKVQFKGTVIRSLPNDCIIGSVRVRNDQTGEEAYIASKLITPAPKYDPCRKFRKGDLVRITGYYGRLFGSAGSIEPDDNHKLIGELVTLAQDERGGNVTLYYDVLPNKRNFLSVACIELVKPVEEIKEEQKPYYVKGGVVRRRKDGKDVVIIDNEDGVLSSMAQIICSLLNEEFEELSKTKNE